LQVLQALGGENEGIHGMNVDDTHRVPSQRISAFRTMHPAAGVFSFVSATVFPARSDNVLPLSQHQYSTGHEYRKSMRQHRMSCPGKFLEDHDRIERPRHRWKQKNTDNEDTYLD
jgi:hypothetical protein